MGREADMGGKGRMQQGHRGEEGRLWEGREGMRRGLEGWAVVGTGRGRQGKPWQVRKGREDGGARC